MCHKAAITGLRLMSQLGFLAARSALWGMLLAVSLFAGCSQLPPPAQLPSVSARGAGAKAISLYDGDEDGTLVREEVQESAALQATWGLLDADEDGAITAKEIAARIRMWQKSSARVVVASPTFYLGEEPLVGASITLEPAKILGSAYPIVSAVTDRKGTAHFGGSDPSYPGVYSGLYTVRVSKKIEGKEIIPARYNSQSELGIEISKANWFGALRWFGLEAEQ
ncbi:MAG: hypothetical protein ACR2NU_12785 [Aeoliella sp.]